MSPHAAAAKRRTKAATTPASIKNPTGYTAPSAGGPERLPRMAGSEAKKNYILRERSSDAVEHIVQVVADEREGGDKDDRDQSRDQAILDCGGPALAADELEQLRHVDSPYSRCGPLSPLRSLSPPPP